MKNAPDTDEVDALDVHCCVFVGITISVTKHMIVLADNPSDGGSYNVRYLAPARHVDSKSRTRPDDDVLQHGPLETVSILPLAQ